MRGIDSALSGSSRSVSGHLGPARVVLIVLFLHSQARRDTGGSQRGDGRRQRGRRADIRAGRKPLLLFLSHVLAS